MNQFIPAGSAWSLLSTLEVIKEELVEERRSFRRPYPGNTNATKRYSLTIESLTSALLELEHIILAVSFAAEYDTSASLKEKDLKVIVTCQELTKELLAAKVTREYLLKKKRERDNA